MGSVFNKPNFGFSDGHILPPLSPADQAKADQLRDLQSRRNDFTDREYDRQVSAIFQDNSLTDRELDRTAGTIRSAANSPPPPAPPPAPAKTAPSIPNNTSESSALSSKTAQQSTNARTQPRRKTPSNRTNRRTILTSPLGLLGTANTTRKTLLGQ